MALIASEGSQSSIPPCPAGAYAARCFMMIDMGTQPESYMGQSKESRKVRIGFEIPEQTHIFKDDVGPEPYTVSAKYTNFLGDRANLRHMLEAWRGKPFTPEELKSFDLKKIVGAPALINVIHKPRKRDNKIFAEINNITQLPKGLPCPPAINQPLIYEIEDGTKGAWERIPTWIQNDIKKAKEFVVSPQGHTGEGAQSSPEPEPENDNPF